MGACSRTTPPEDPPTGAVEPEPALPVAPAPADTRPADGVTPPEPTPEPRAESFEAALAAIDPDDLDALGQAADAFVDFHSGDAVDEVTRKAGIDALVAFTEPAIEGIYRRMSDSEPLNLAVCVMTDDCKAEQHTAESKAIAKVLKSSGVTFVYGGEGMFDAVPDYDVIAKRIASALSPAATAYFAALDFQITVVDSSYDEDGFGGDPTDVADALRRWESLRDMGEPYAAVGESRAEQAFGQYLSMCDSNGWEQPYCTVSPKMRKSYAGFDTTNPGSKYGPAVAKFFAIMKRHKFRANEKKLTRAIETAERELPKSP